MRVVIDTNVVISGIFFGGPPAKVLEAVLDEQYQVILSEEIIKEYFEILHRISEKRNAPIDPGSKIINILISNAIIIDATNAETPQCADPDDIKFLQAAIASNAKFLISGDKHLLDVGKYKGGIVLKPKEFLLSR